MSNTKIERCPMPGCGGEMFWYDNVTRVGMSSLQCGRCAYELRDFNFTKEEATAVHNQHCRLVELGRQVDEAFRDKGQNGMLDMRELLHLGKLVEKFKENPPKQEYPMGSRYDGGWADAIRACLDM
ncbi:unnamed protein product, partial [marine sediment metagenome]